MSDEDEFEIQVGADSIKVSAKGGLASQLGSVTGVLTEPFAILHDKVRIYKELSFLRALKRAAEIAEKENLPIGKAPSKFLIHWAEGASMEEDGEAGLTDKWANLLISAAKDFQPGHLLFARILTEITGAEARLIDRIARCGNPDELPPASLEDAVFNWRMFSAPASPFSEGAFDYRDEQSLQDAIGYFFRPGIAIETIELFEGDGPPYETIWGSDFPNGIISGSDYITLEILISLNLVEKVEQEYNIDGYHIMNGIAYCLTYTGAKFFWACAGERR